MEPALLSPSRVLRLLIPYVDVRSYRQLHILRVGNNSLNGSIRIQDFDLRLLSVLDVSQNQ
jgi:hypothetical protein